MGTTDIKFASYRNGRCVKITLAPSVKFEGSSLLVCYTLVTGK